ncbi:MAG: cysteine peptidase family C39 domain-containing protein [Thermoguttaceae bacterium]
MNVIAFPELRQIYNYDCGCSALCSILTYLGYDVREDALMALAGTTPADGTPNSGILTVLTQYAVEYRPVKTVGDVQQALANRHPVLLDLQAWADQGPVDYATDTVDGHYVIAIGASVLGRMICEDPSAYTRTWMTWDELETRWHDIEGSQPVRFGLEILSRGTYSPNDMEHMD